MEAEIERATNEIKRLKGCINNLISVQALPAIWSGGQPSQIVSALLDMMLEMLSLDFAYARLNDSTGWALEMARLAQDRNLTAQPQMIGRALNPWLDDFPHVSPSLVRNPIGDGDVSVLLLRLGLQAEIGVFVAGSKRADFPTQTERLLLNVAANQAAIGLQEARLLSEQKRIAKELDQRVAQRTSQLRTSEQLARSHVEVLMRSLDVLATEAAPEKFIGEMLRTIGQHLRAHRVTLWLRNQQDDSLQLRVAIEKDNQTAHDRDHPLTKDPYGWKKEALIQEMLVTKSPVVADDIEHDSRIDSELREYLKLRKCKRFLGVPMFVSGQMRGLIGIQHSEHGAYRTEEVELAQALAHHVMLATHGQELVEQQHEAAILKERTRMARDIHDTLAQAFTGVIVQLDAAVEALRDEEPEAAAKHIRRARELARESLIEARRSVHALRPQALEKASFADALKAIITNTTAGTSLQSDFELKGEPRELQPSIEENLLHIGQEALTNALRHACATRFQARLSFDSNAVRLELRDNGKGFIIDNANGRGIGLIGMKERAQQIGATLAITSEPSAGTTIIAVSHTSSQ